MCPFKGKLKSKQQKIRLIILGFTSTKPQNNRKFALLDAYQETS
jgi:hypothetical protein